MLSCICLDDEEDELGIATEDRPTTLPPPSPSPPQQCTETRYSSPLHSGGVDRDRNSNSMSNSPLAVQKERKKLRDKVTIFTGALGSRDQCDEEEEEEEEEEEFSEDGFEYQEDGLFDPGDFPPDL